MCEICDSTVRHWVACPCTRRVVNKQTDWGKGFFRDGNNQSLPVGRVIGKPLAISKALPGFFWFGRKLDPFEFTFFVFFPHALSLCCSLIKNKTVSHARTHLTSPGHEKQLNSNWKPPSPARSVSTRPLDLIAFDRALDRRRRVYRHISAT